MRGAPRYLRTDVEDASSTAAAVPLWWPPAKIVGRYLAPFLAERMGMKEPLSPEPEFDFVRVEVELDE